VLRRGLPPLWRGAREVLAVEPQLTLTKLRARTMYLNARGAVVSQTPAEVRV